MDIFGEQWTGHQEKLRQRWLATVTPEDTVIVAGDISWGTKLAEALPDLQWLAGLPGTKVLLRGNHDYWWSSKKTAAALQSLLPPTLLPLHRSSHVVEAGGARVGLIGTRGWDYPPAAEHDAQIVAHEEQRLLASIASLPTVDQVIGVLHYPPLTLSGEPTPFSRLLIEAGANLILYGHIHGGIPYPSGERDGVTYRNVSADAVDFTPQPIL